MSSEPAAKHILLVEDMEDNRDMLTRRLLRSGFKVTAAVDGEEALELASTVSPDLILMDMSLPKIDGWEVTRRLRETNASPKLRIIALTAHAMIGDEEKAMAAGCDDYDTKPIDYARLLAKMTRQLAI